MRSPTGRLLLIVAFATFVLMVVVGLAGPGRGPSTAPSVPSAAGASVSPEAGASAQAVASAQASGSAADLAPSPAPLAPSPVATTRPTITTGAACAPTDQDRYVYHPARLEVLARCIRVSGTVDAVRKEADGDLHILLALDAPYRHLLRPSNQGEELGDLVVEPVCVRGVTQADAIAVCAADPDPLRGPFPSVGEHVWMEGRSVLDLEHGSWAELHPLYRWGSR